MQLEHVEIERFRAIDRLSVRLDLLTTVIGEPDAAKSSLLGAVARVLSPYEPEQPPSFSVADFHRSGDREEDRAETLSITIGVRLNDDHDTAEPADGEVRRAARGGSFRVRIEAKRRGDDAPLTTIAVLDDDGAAAKDVEGASLLATLRRRRPAVIVGGPRRSARAPEPKDGESTGRARAALLEASRPREPLTWDVLGHVRDELVEAAAALAEQLGPAPERRRSVREMTDTPRPLETDLSTALLEDAVPQRRIAAIWLLVAIVDALPPDGIGPDAEPILLFDDIEANLHPTWLAALTAVALNLPFQQVVATYSPEVLTWVPLGSLRRLVRTADGIEARFVRADGYSNDELRRLTYHLRLNRGSSFFARCWVLVEGETEAWLIPEFARIAGVEFPIEGIRVIEFAQSGLAPLLKVAADLGIRWIMLADGDRAGKAYERTVRERSRRGSAGEAVVLPARDIENYLFRSGYEDVIRKAAGRTRSRKANDVIRKAIENTSKPALALEILAAADDRGEAGVPPILRELAETARDLARGDVDRHRPGP